MNLLLTLSVLANVAMFTLLLRYITGNFIIKNKKQKNEKHTKKIIKRCTKDYLNNVGSGKRDNELDKHNIYASLQKDYKGGLGVSEEGGGLDTDYNRSIAITIHSIRRGDGAGDDIQPSGTDQL